MIIETFRPEHLRFLRLQRAQEFLQAEILNAENAEAIAAAGNAYTAIDDGDVIGCGGIIIKWENHALAWVLLSRDMGMRRLRAFHRAVENYLETRSERRIEATVDSAFVNGHQWMHMLGFEFEGRMRAYSPQGRDHDLYARIRK